MARRIAVTAAVLLACASVACVGDDTVNGPSPGVQGGSGPPPSSYDATVDGPGGGQDATADVVDATTPDAGARDAAGDARSADAARDASSADANDAASVDGSDASSADANDAASVDAGDATTDAASADAASDAGDAADGD